MNSCKLKIVESILYDFPKINTELERYKNFLLSMALNGPGGEGDKVDGGRGGSSPQQRYLDSLARNKFYVVMDNINKVILSEYRKLSAQQQMIVDLIYFRRASFEEVLIETKYTRSHLYVKKNEILLKLYKPLLRIISPVEEWRDAEQRYFESNIKK